MPGKASSQSEGGVATEHERIVFLQAARVCVPGCCSAVTTTHLLHMDHVKVVRCEQRSNRLGVGRLIAWDVIVLEDLGQACDVHGEDAEPPRRHRLRCRYCRCKNPWRPTPTWCQEEAQTHYNEADPHGETRKIQTAANPPKCWNKRRMKKDHHGILLQLLQLFLSPKALARLRTSGASPSEGIRFGEASPLCSIVVRSRRALQERDVKQNSACRRRWPAAFGSVPRGGHTPM